MSLFIDDVILTLLAGKKVHKEITIGDFTIRLSILPGGTMQDIKRDELEQDIHDAIMRAVGEFYQEFIYTSKNKDGKKYERPD
jgi:hypothetical protein